MLAVKKFARLFCTTREVLKAGTWQERWYYRVGLLTGFWGGTAVGLLMAVTWYVFNEACGG